MFLLASITENSQCMEQPKQLERKIEENELGSFSNFPEVLIEYLFYFIPEASSMKEIFKKLAQLSLINSKFKEIVESKVLLKELGKRYIKFHRLEAEKQFLDASDQILRGNKTKEYDTIIATLLPGINFTLKNKILIDASKKGTVEIVKLVLNSGPIDDFYANVALMYASKKGTIEIVKLLLDSGANVNAISEDGDTALMRASKKGNIEIVELLLNSGADINAISDNGNTALIMAAEGGHREIVEVLLNNGASNGSTNKVGSTALIVAAMNGHKEAIKLLLDNNADINAKDHYRCTALTYASRNGDKEIVKLLLDFGADGHAPIRKLIKAALLGKKEKGKRVLEKWVGIDENDSIISNFIEEKRLLTSIPEAKSVQDILKQLDRLSQVDSRLEATIETEAFIADLAKGYCRSHLQQADRELADALELIINPAQSAKENKIVAFIADSIERVISPRIANEHKIATFLAYGIPFFNKNSNLVGVALVRAAHKNNSQIVRLLLERGADANARDIYGNTALILASRHGHHEIVKLLLNRGADVNAITNIGHTALAYASKDGNEEIVKLLIDRGADVTTELMRTTRYDNGNKEIVKLLLDNGADANARDIYGNTALFLASAHGHHEIVKLLLNRGADVNAITNNGHTALMRASLNGNKEIVKLLLDSHANITIKNNQGNTALMLNLKGLYDGRWGIGNDDITKIARLLLEADYFDVSSRAENLNVNAANHDGDTALMWAACLNRIELLWLLIYRGADANAKNNIGETALMIALKVGNTKAADFLKSYPLKSYTTAYSAKSSNCCLQ